MLTPSDPARKVRWETVLAWYGLSFAASPLSCKTVPELSHLSCVSDDADVVAVLDTTSLPAARLFAVGLNRPLLYVTDDNYLQKLLFEHSLRSLVFIGAPSLFNVRHLEFLHSYIKGPWGVVTAPDLPGLTFVVAKLLARNTNKDRPWATIDAFTRTAREFTPHELPPRPQSLSPELTYELVCRRDWHTLALAAHGEGGHANLHSIVLCGLVGEMELSLSGQEIDGCRWEGGIRKCKRVHEPNITVLSFGDLRTERLCFLSCNGFSVAGELYPSNVSCILSAAEGYPSEILTTDQPAWIESFDSYIALGLLHLNSGLGDLQQFANEKHLALVHTKPYVLFGDPSPHALHWSRPSEEGILSPPYLSPLVPLTIPSKQAPVILELDSMSSRAKLVLGIEHGAVLLEEPETAVSLQLVERTERWNEILKEHKAFARTLHQARSLEHAVEHLYQGSLQRDSSFREKLVTLTELRVKVEQSVQRVLWECQAMKRSGIWSDSVENRAKVAYTYVTLWDRHFAELTNEYLFRGNYEHVLTYGLEEKVRTQGEACQRCGSAITFVSAVDPLAVQMNRVQASCPTCGTQGVWTEDGPHLFVKLPEHLVPHSTIDLIISIQCSQTATSSHTGPGVLIGEFTDKGCGKPFFRILESVTGHTIIRTIAIPESISSDLHTLRLVWVERLNVSFLRLRSPALKFL